MMSKQTKSQSIWMKSSKTLVSQLWADNTKRYVYGYRYGEVPLPDLKELENNVKITFGPKKIKNHILPMSRKMNVFHKDAAPFFADKRDENTILAGCCYRVLRGTNKPNDNFETFKSFSKMWIKENFTPLPAETDVSYETFRSKIKIPEWRKKEYDLAWNDVMIRFENKIMKKKDFKVAGFIKEESYPTYKHARMINARSDNFKVCFGPFIQCISDHVFNKPYFIKNVAVQDRANYVNSYLSQCGTIFESDFTSFESSHNPTIMSEIENWFYKYMCRDLPSKGLLCYLLKQLTDNNEINIGNISMELKGKRMSGEMNTSLGNSIMNKLLCEYAAFCQGLKIKSIHEGDDGLIGFDKYCDISQFEKCINDMGYEVKLVQHHAVGDASFCGLIFSSNGHCIREPFDVMINFDTCREKYINSSNFTINLLLRCKAMSLLYESPHCPILREFALYILRNTYKDQKGFVEKFLKKYEHKYSLQNENFTLIYESMECAFEAISKKTIPFETRFYFEKKFGVPINAQFYIENIFKTANKLQNFNDPIINTLIPYKYFEHSLKYVKLQNKLSLISEPGNSREAKKMIRNLPGMVRTGKNQYKKKIQNPNFN